MKRVAIVVGAFVIAVFVITMVVGPKWEEANIAATHSAVESVYYALLNSNVLNVSANDWQVLEDSEYGKVIIALKNAGESIDAPDRWRSGKGFVADPWGNRLQVAARRTEAGTIEVIVWSRGPDGISGTSDDIIVPEKTPFGIEGILQSDKDKKREEYEQEQKGEIGVGYK